MTIIPILFAAAVVAATGNRMPSDAIDALRATKSGVLYSLEPWAEPASTNAKFHGYDLLGQTALGGANYRTAAREFEAAVERAGEGASLCFDPRHALSFESATHRYDLLLCYACRQIAVYRDDQHVATLAATGSDKTLNALLRAASVPVSTSYDEDAEIARAQQFERDAERWEEAMPTALRPLWRRDLALPDREFLLRMRAAIDQELPDPAERIGALYRWYGSGAGPWSGFPAYEAIAEQLLLTHTTEELLAFPDIAQFTETQMEGAARLLGGWYFSKERPGDLARVPEAWKAQLLAHALRSTNKDKRARAERAFRH